MKSEPEKIRIHGITQRHWDEIVRPWPDHGTFYIYHVGRKTLGINWGREESWDKLGRPAKQQGATHNGRYWTFPKGAEEFFQRAKARVPDMAVVRLDADCSHYQYAHADLGSDQVIVVKLPVPGGLPGDDKTPSPPKQYLTISTTEGDWIVITDLDHVKVVLEFLREKEAKDVSNLWDFHRDSKVRVQVVGWAVIAHCDLADPRHYHLKPKQKETWDKSGRDLKKVYIPWDGKIFLTREGWPDLAEKFAEAGIGWEGEDPTAPMSLGVEADLSAVPGWKTAAPNGFLLHNYQKDGIRICVNRGMRVLIGDEMGIGKTAQAIGAAIATNAQKILVVATANARWVWDAEIKGWTGNPTIQHIQTSLTQLEDVQWHIATYDVLIARPASWTLNDPAEKSAVEAVVGSLKLSAGTTYPTKIPLTRYYDKVPAFVSKAKVTKWSNAMRRLQHELLTNLLERKFDLLVVDEAHRAKNEDAKRSIVLTELSQQIRHVLLLTGTPMRNHPGEAAVLLGYLDARAAEALSAERGYTLEDLQENLKCYMFRRKKEEVLSELPEKIRQIQEIDKLDEDQLEEYERMLALAREDYKDAIKEGKSDAEAREAMRGGIAKARVCLGLAKILGGQVVDIIANVVEQKKNVVVFCSHHDCSDSLKVQLRGQGYTVELIDGRTPQHLRAQIVRDFQALKIQILIGSINAAGESITLTKADTVIFVELDWVPAALRQAEDRIHRVGQERGCHIIHLLARGTNLDSAMGRILLSKLDSINRALGESDQVFGTHETSEMQATFDSVLAYVLKDKRYLKAHLGTTSARKEEAEH